MLRQLRNWFTRSEIAQDAPGQAPLSQGDREKLDELQRAVDRLSAQHADMQLAWAETLDKLSAWASRQQTRDRRALAAKLEPQEEQETAHAPPVEHSAPAPTKAELRARLAAMQRKALG